MNLLKNTLNIWLMNVFWRLGLKILYPEITSHPMKWVDRFSNLNSTKTDFFEQKVTNYVKASSLDSGDL